MACYVKYDSNGKITCFGAMSVANIGIQELEPGEKIVEIDGMEKGLDKNYTVDLDENKTAKLSKTGKATLKKKDV